ncbi:PREDICTED: RNA pseudouridine synthase 4, mitochondrial-like isoform X2 [Nelumbo nucifera]|uniref:RNA pseudouridine synthase 4, mitochondrial-like isoform X2 n=1 Tax=Nelumbo nucifera TaxID=4432 RepID=A0A1U8BFZ6_NELNU|nr:PREDICTED: RNA pseudouridine synthase 4, mitochondrial-like isoform X2 [Nelumbo nucifera]
MIEARNGLLQCHSMMSVGARIDFEGSERLLPRTRYAGRGGGGSEYCGSQRQVAKLRVHCAEVLGTPIVGDYKYGWQAHRKWKPLSWSNSQKNKKLPRSKECPFGLSSEGGSIVEKQPHLHLHCRQMILPNISLALQHLKSSSNCDLSELESLNLMEI